MDSASERADAIEARRKRNHAIDADAAESGFEADDAAERSGNADGAAGVRADAAVAKAGGDGGSGTAAGTSRNARKIPGIVDGAVVRVVAGDAVGELVHVGLAKDDGACFFELCDDCGIVLGMNFQEFLSLPWCECPAV